MQNWRKSSHSGSGDQCVEVSGAASVVGIRDSKDLGIAPLSFGRAAVAALVTGLK